MQSHATIVVRELGTPAVVSDHGAMTRIRDGGELEVDGSLGAVRILTSQDDDRRP